MRARQLTHYTLPPGFAFELSRCLRNHPRYVTLEHSKGESSMRSAFLESRTSRKIYIAADESITRILIAQANWAGNREATMAYPPAQSGQDVSPN